MDSNIEITVVKRYVSVNRRKYTIKIIRNPRKNSLFHDNFFKKSIFFVKRTSNDCRYEENSNLIVSYFIV